LEQLQFHVLSFGVLDFSVGYKGRSDTKLRPRTSYTPLLSLSTNYNKNHKARLKSGIKYDLYTKNIT